MAHTAGPGGAAHGRDAAAVQATQVGPGLQLAARQL
jgi:hypothetical protein